MNASAQREYWAIRVTFYDDDDSPVEYWFRDWEAGSTVPEYTPLKSERFPFADENEALTTRDHIRKIDKDLAPVVRHVSLKKRGGG